jgi:hypothetical protein
VKHSLSIARIGSSNTGAGEVNALLVTAERLSMREQLKLTGLLAFIIIMYIVGGYIDA